MSRRIERTLSHVAVVVLTIVAGTSSATLAAAEPAVMGTFSDGNLAVVLPTPDVALPTPTQAAVTGMPGDATPHGAAFRTQDEALFADFFFPRLYRVRVSTNTLIGTIALTGRTSGNGTIAVSPDGNTAISVGERNLSGQPLTPEIVVIRGIVSGNLTATSLSPALRVRRFATAAVDFDAAGRAYVCHVDGISLIEPPYASVTRTVALPASSGTSVCRVTRDGQRLFVTRGDGPVYVVESPATASAPSATILPPAGAGFMSSLALSPADDALLVGQLFRSSTGSDARLFLVRAPFSSSSTMQEIALPASVSGSNCGTGTQLCPGFEDMAVSADGSLAIATGNSSVVDAGFVGRVPAVFVRTPFVDATRTVSAVQIGNPANANHGRGTGSVRFRPIDIAIFGDSYE
jgi:hypothetical protein